MAGVLMDAIARIAIGSRIRVILNAQRIVYVGRWTSVPVWFDIGLRDMAYAAEFKALACVMSPPQYLWFNNVKVHGKGQGDDLRTSWGL